MNQITKVDLEHKTRRSSLCRLRITVPGSVAPVLSFPPAVIDQTQKLQASFEPGP